MHCVYDICESNAANDGFCIHCSLRVPHRPFIKRAPTRSFARLPPSAQEPKKKTKAMKKPKILGLIEAKCQPRLRMCHGCSNKSLGLFRAKFVIFYLHTCAIFSTSLILLLPCSLEKANKKRRKENNQLKR